MKDDIHAIVSDHAALRYLERVRGVDVGDRGNLTERGWLVTVCKRIGTTVEAVKTGILPPLARAAVAAGAIRFVAADYTLIITTGRDGHRFVVSVLTTRMHKKPQFPKKVRRR